MSNLAEYLVAAGKKQRAFAEQIGVDKSIVSRLCRREMRPSLDLAFAIERETGGAVPAASWVDPPQAHEAAE